MNINELMKLKEEVKSMTEEERRQRVVKIENKMESTNIVDKAAAEEYVILTNGLWDLDDMNVALNNVRTKDEIYSMVDTKGALQEIEALAEENTIVLWNESYTDQDFTMTDPGIVVSKDFYEKASKKLRAKKDNKGVSSDDLSNIELTKDDCLDDVVVIHYSCAVKDAENDYEEVDFSKLSTRLVHFNEFYKGIMDLGYNFHYFSEPESITFNDYLDVVNNPDSSYFDFSIEDPKYYEQAKKQH